MVPHEQKDLSKIALVFRGKLIKTIVTRSLNRNELNFFSKQKN